MTEAICFLLDNPQKRDEMGRLGREHVERVFNVGVPIRKLDEIYDWFCLEREIWLEGQR